MKMTYQVCFFRFKILSFDYITIMITFGFVIHTHAHTNRHTTTDGVSYKRPGGSTHHAKSERKAQRGKEKQKKKSWYRREKIENEREREARERGRDRQGVVTRESSTLL